MPTGGCACGNIKYAYEGDPAAVAICHCIPCRRSTNSTYSTNILVPEAQFKSTGKSPKTWQRKGDSGSAVTNHFCDTCGSLVYVIAETIPGTVLVKSGTLDDLSLNNSDKYKPGVEIYCRNKYAWLPEVEGVKTFEGSMS